jgi:flagellar biosynthesis/type III secretory pathway M-ring protein FliF/YscJ
MRALALAAFLIAAGLLGWRASLLLTATNTPPAHASPLETSLLNLVEPVAGPGKARISVTRDAGAGRTVLVLLDVSASDSAPTIERLVQTAARLDPGAGDALVIEQAAFARGTPGRPSSSAYGELSMLGLLAALLGWLAFGPARETETAASVEAPHHPASTPLRPMTEPALRPVRTALPSADAADLVRKDPARAADILRGWMSGGSDAA